jgi:acetyl-CoA acetyltransferase family protein
VRKDECNRPDTTLAGLQSLKPSFKPDGTVTAGNASQLSDGAAALLLADEDGLRELGREPLARVSGSGVDGVDPYLFGIAPVRAAERALAKAGRGWGDLAAVELNEAFAAQSLACLAEWTDLDPDLVNPQGGAIALGHPLGCSGARIVGSLAWQLRRRGSGTGLAAICIGVGQGLAVVLER